MDQRVDSLGPGGPAESYSPARRALRAFIHFWSYHLILARQSTRRARAAGFRLVVRPEHVQAVQLNHLNVLVGNQVDDKVVAAGFVILPKWCERALCTAVEFLPLLLALFVRALIHLQSFLGVA